MKHISMQAATELLLDLVEQDCPTVSQHVQYMANYLATYLRYNDHKLHGHTLDMLSDAIIALKSVGKHKRTREVNDVIGALSEYSQFGTAYLVAGPLLARKSILTHKQSVDSFVRQIVMEAHTVVLPTTIIIQYNDEQKNVAELLHKKINDSPKKTLIDCSFHRQHALNDVDLEVVHSWLSQAQKNNGETYSISIGLTDKKILSSFAENKLHIVKKQLTKDNIIRAKLGGYNFYKTFKRLDF